MGQLSLDKTFLLAPWIEALVYGFFVCVFCATLYIQLSSTPVRHQDGHSNIMIGISCLMFIIATWHMAMDVYRLIEGYVDHRLTSEGPVGYIGNLRLWHHILKDILFVTQENLGSAASIYRCWILWNRKWKIVIVPSILLVVNIVAGYLLCSLYSSVNPTESVFSDKLNKWIKTFFSIAVVLNIVTTSLMGYRIWITHRQSANYQAGNSRLIQILRILVESAALQLVVEIVLLALYANDINAQYIVLESAASVVGITFNIITLRIKLYEYKYKSSVDKGSQPTNPTQTIGSMPMRRIQINITQDVEDQTDSFDQLK